jgi:hypothetical protein
MNISNAKTLTRPNINIFEKGSLASTTDFQHIEQPSLDITGDGFLQFRDRSESRKYLISSRFNPEMFNRAVQAICNRYGLQEHNVESQLLHLYVFDVNTKKLSTSAIINLWDDYYLANAANDSDYNYSDDNY